MKVYVSMSDVQRKFLKFRERSLVSDEKIAFAVIAGDFNVDNISPSKAFSINNLYFFILILYIFC